MEFDKEEVKMRSALYKKKSKLRELVLQQDWKKDGFMLLGGKRVDYITSEKIIRNFAPLLPKVGLELECGFDEPKRMDPFGQRAEEHWVASFHVRYVDIDTGYMTEVNRYYGEGMDQRDKSLKKASTDAQKLWLLADFKIGEGIDPDAGTNDTTGAYIPKGEEENVEIKTKIAAVAVKPKAPVPKPKKAEETVEAPVRPRVENENVKDFEDKVENIKKDVENAVKKIAEEVKTETPAAPKKPAAPKVKKEVPAEKPAEAAPAADDSKISPGMNTEYGAKISEVQKKPLFSSIQKWSMANREGKISDEKYAQVKEAYKNIGSNKDIIKFLTEYREVKE